MLISSLLVIAGLALLVGGGHYLVEGATRLSLRTRISPTVVGLTVVALGTSMPELAVSLEAAIHGNTDISYANVVGSNIFNVAAVLGIAALIAPIPVQGRMIKIEYPFMVVVLILGLAMARDGWVDRLDGAIFVFVLSSSLIALIRWSRSQPPDAETLELEREYAAHVGLTDRRAVARAWLVNIVMIAAGIGLLAGGAALLIRGAIDIATRFHVTHRVIGLTLVAGGTSLPELAASITAAVKGRPGLALGNIVGSNIFNVLWILGITSLIVPIPVNPAAVALDNWVMVGFAVLLFVFLVMGKRLTRIEGGIMLALFVGYMARVVAT